ncbi:MAG: polymer-forming cytoskeletal protein [Deltaproteobacteria bacterium]|nr:polymer-forming cytoskeletal protein [Deltaproteobacteria bacterium]
MAFGRSGKDDKETTSHGSVDTTSVSGAAGKLEAFLGKGSKVVGNLTFSGPVELDGHVEGEIVAQDKLTVGESAVVNAKIMGGEVIIKGTVNGDVSASKRLSVRRPARIIGNISTSNLSIEEGVIFEGKCIMGSGSALSSDKGSASAKPVTPVKLGAA